MTNHTLLYYQDNSSSLANRYESADVTEIQHLLLNTFTKNKNLLEIGCGSGRDANFMFENGYDIIAIDGSKNMIEEAKKIHPNLSNRLFHKILPNDLVFDYKFDGIYSIATLMHLDKKELIKAIQKIYNLLNDDGLFVISVSLFRDDIDKYGFDKKGRFFLVLSKNEWIDICQKVGFSVKYIKTNKDGLNRENIEWLTLVLKKCK